MALQIPYEITCTCGATFTRNLYEYVFTEYDSGIQDILLQGQFNTVECPSCNQHTYVENRFIYRDGANKLWVWVCKQADREVQTTEEQQAIKEQRFIENHYIHDLSSYTKYTVYGIQELLALLGTHDPELVHS
nr:CpXC domain-containing protein [uncultured Desulfobulbus sp.]